MRAEAGSRPGGRGTCSLLRQRKVPKRKAALQSATSAGQTCVGVFAGCAVELALRCARRSDNHGESDHEACARRRPCHPANAPPQAQPEGGGQPNSPTAKQPHGPLLRSAQSAQRVALAPGRCGPSEAMARRDVRLRVPFTMRRGAQRPADQGSRLFERNAVERVRARPRWARAPQVARSEAKGRSV